jgi:hypothetical protein
MSTGLFIAIVELVLAISALVGIALDRAARAAAWQRIAEARRWDWARCGVPAREPDE